MVIKKKNYFHDGFKSEEHKKNFDVWNKMSSNYFRYVFSSFEENKYLLNYQSVKNEFTILDYGCSSGYLKRFLNFFYGKNYTYNGYDISKESVNLAKKLYGEENFFSEDEYLQNDDLRKKKYDIVYSRDTVLHQKEPWKFIDELVSKVKKKLILRLRTRNKGDTILDIQNNYQVYANESKIPYLVLNYNELIQYLKKLNFKFIVTNRSTTILGGKYNRYLDKSLYLEETESAETSILASFEKNLNQKNLIETHNLEGHKYLKEKYFKTLFYKVLNRLKI
tara:strand:- start:22 stop:858 length:837 start_codon:yes stop_codon:yes gene_type:complete